MIPTTPSARAQSVGLVCIADSSASDCPISPIVLSGTNGTTLTIAVNIQSSDSLNGFDIIVKSDYRVLQPVSADLTGNVLGSNIFTVANCIEFVGAGCSAITGHGLVRVAAVALGTFTTSPTTGRLFSITYNVLASASDLKVGFQTGCFNTSAPPDYCVTIADGGLVVPETVQESTGNIGDFGVTAPSGSVIVRKGTSVPFEIFFSSVDGFSGSISFSFSISPVKRNGPTVILLTTGVINLLPGTFTIVLFGAQAGRNTPNGLYTFTLTANAGRLTHSVQVTISVVRS